MTNQQIANPYCTHSTGLAQSRAGGPAGVWLDTNKEEETRSLPQAGERASTSEQMMTHSVPDQSSFTTDIFPTLTKYSHCAKSLQSAASFNSSKNYVRQALLISILRIINVTGWGKFPALLLTMELVSGKAGNSIQFCSTPKLLLSYQVIKTLQSLQKPKTDPSGE